MSKADEMFEKLGYFQRKIKDEIRYTRHENKAKIVFKLNLNEVLSEYVDGSSSSITMRELQAINKKVKELGWL